MPPKTEISEFIDGLFQFDLGVNSDIAPLLLPKNQLSFATNATVRGTFITDRPPVRKVPFDFGDDEGLAEAVKKGLFQACCVYNPDFGDTALMVAISGRLFRCVIGQGTTAFVSEKTVEVDPNPAGVTQAWMWQFERWVIWNDGQSLPVFYDGDTSRRSYGPSVDLGTTALNFTVPARNEDVVVTFTAPYTGRFNVPIYIGAALYQPKAQAAGYKVTLSNLTDTPGNSIPVGQTVIVEPGFLASITQAFITPAYNSSVTIKISRPVSLSNLDSILINGVQYRTNFIVSNLSTFVVRNITPGSTAGVTVPVGTDVRLSATSSPNFPIGDVVDAFIVPAVGSTVEVNLTNPYTGPANQPVIIGTAQYFLTAGSPNAIPGAAIVMINLSDVPGTTVNSGTNAASVPELPAGRMGAYGLGRNWMSLIDGKSFIASDIVGGSSGTQAFNYRDAPMRVTENVFLFGGGNFVVPGTVGDIRAMVFTATLDASLGQGPLQVFTPNGVFSCQAPVDRTTWQTITNPILTQSLIANGGLAQDSTILVNGDTHFRAVNGEYSLILARRDFQVSWGNTPLSIEMSRVLSKDDQSLLGYGSAIYFDNRKLSTASPQTSPGGVFHAGTIAQNFDPVSGARDKAPPVWDGLWTGLNVLKYVKGLFNGTQRAFAFCYNATNLEIELYEILPTGPEHFDNGTTRIMWGFESPSIFKEVKGKTIFDLVTLIDGEISVDEVVGRVDFQAYYKPDQYPCWIPWHSWSICAETPNPLAVTAQNANLQPAFQPRMGLGEPDVKMCDTRLNRPFRDGYTFQFKLVVSGHCRFLGAKFRAIKAPEPKFALPICTPICTPEPEVETLFWNTAQTATASCTGGVNPTSYTVPARSFSSDVSQAAVNATALLFAQQRATASLDCDCPVIDWSATITVSSPVSTFDPDGFGYRYEAQQIQVTAGTVVNIFIREGETQNLHILDSDGVVIETQFNANSPSLFVWTAPLDGTYTIAISATPDTFPHAFRVATDCSTIDYVPCPFPTGIEDLDFAIDGYINTFFDVSACDGAASALQDWNGEFTDFNGGQYWDIDSSNYPSNLSINGKRLTGGWITYNESSCADPNTLSKAFWTVEIWGGDNFESLIWAGVKYDGNTPAGVYNKVTPYGTPLVAVCTDVDTITLIQI